MRSKSKEREAKYGSVRKMLEKRSSGFTAPYLRLSDGVQLFKPKAGVMLLDIIPFEAGEGNEFAEPGSIWWERTIWVHRGVGANSEAFLCPRKTSRGRCPICEFRAKLQADDSDENEKMIKELVPKQRQLFNVVNRKEPDKGVQIWDISYHLFGKKLEDRIRDADEEDNWDLFFLPDKGLTLKVGFSEESYAGRAYLEASTIDFKPRDPLDDDIVEAAVCLDELLVETPYDKLKATFLETKSEDEDEDEEEEEEDDTDEDDADDGARTGKRGKKTKHVEEDDPEDEEDEPKSKKSKKDEDDDEDDDWDDFDKKKGKSKSKKDEDDEDDDDEDDDDEEEESPKKKGKKSKDEEDDFDDLDEEDEEEEEPRSKKKGKKK